MSPVLEAVPQIQSSTSVSDQSVTYHNEWLGFLGGEFSIIREKRFCLPELSTYLVERPGGSWFLVKGGTIRSLNATVQFGFDIVGDIESPLMPANKQLPVKLIIKHIRKGRPSICDELGL